MTELKEYKEKLCKRLEEYMDMPVNAHNIEVISDTITCLDCLKEFEHEYKMREVHFEEKHAERMTRHDAEEWVKRMENADGTYGGHWTMEQTEDVRRQNGYSCSPAEFYAVMNMCYSDYCEVARAYGVNSDGFYAELACAFLNDADARDGKAMRYYDCIAE